MEDSKAKEDALKKELSQKDELIESLRSQLLLSGDKINGQSSQSRDIIETTGSDGATDQLLDAQKKASLAQEEVESYRHSAVCIVHNLSHRNLYVSFFIIPQARKQEEIENLQKQFEQLKTSYDSLLQTWQDDKTQSMALKEKIAQLTEETNKLALRNAQLSQQADLSQQQCQRLEKENEDVQKRCIQLEEENQEVKRLLSDAEARDENSEKMQTIRAQLAEMESSVSEKNKTIKLQQQRLADMKKMLQKELKNQNNDLDNNTPQSCPSPSVNRKSPAATTAVQSEQEDVNFKYLKHVIFKFLTSREYEVK